MAKKIQEPEVPAGGGFCTAPPEPEPEPTEEIDDGSSD